MIVGITERMKDLMDAIRCVKKSLPVEYLDLSDNKGASKTWKLIDGVDEEALLDLLEKMADPNLYWRPHLGDVPPKKVEFGDKISVKIYPEGGIDCLEDSCPYRSECANHRTAGDFRSEDGFAPELTKNGDNFYCKTKKAPLKEDMMFGTYFPEQIDELPRGAWIMKNDKLSLSAYDF